MEYPHTPVLLESVLRYLNPQPGENYIDGTADGGGHSIAILKRIQPGGTLLAIEWDEELFQQLEQRLKKECSRFNKNYELCRSSYTELDQCVRSLRFGPVNGVLFDFGLSSFHLEAARRGFSFQKDEPLDMRYSRSLGQTAADLVMQSSPEELEAILKNFGQERFYYAIAREIVRTRRVHPIHRTKDLVAIIRQAILPRYRHSRLHFATRTFQALRIAVNHEIENITSGLEAAVRVLAPRGRIVTIAFHSLEDAAVKNFFRQPDLRQRFTPLVAKPVRPDREEVIRNARSRSARLRAFQKTS